MLKKYKAFLFLLVAISFSGCNSTTNKVFDNSNKIHINPDYIIIEQPRVVKDQEIQELLALNFVKGNLNRRQQVLLEYEKAVKNDMMGLDLIAKYILVNLIKFENEYAPAWNLYGNLLFKSGNYLEAYDAFDAAVDIDPNLVSTYLNRGIALYYGKRPSVAYDDIYKVYMNDRNDPYIMMWLYLVEQNIRPDEALKNLSERYRLVVSKDNNWAYKIIDVILGDLSEDEFWRTIFENNLLEEGGEINKPERLCEAYFYLGKYHQITGEKEVAQDYFKLSLMTNVKYFIEYQSSTYEVNLYKKILNEEILEVKTNSENK
jgi:lipoprotein NlpI